MTSGVFTGVFTFAPSNLTQGAGSMVQVTDYKESVFRVRFEGIMAGKPMGPGTMTYHDGNQV